MAFSTFGRVIVLLLSYLLLWATYPYDSKNGLFFALILPTYFLISFVSLIGLYRKFCSVISHPQPTFPVRQNQTIDMLLLLTTVTSSIAALFQLGYAVMITIGYKYHWYIVEVSGSSELGYLIWISSFLLYSLVAAFGAYYAWEERVIRSSGA